MTSDDVYDLAVAHHHLKKEWRKLIKTSRNRRDYEEMCLMLDEQWWADVMEFFGHLNECDYGIGGNICICRKLSEQPSKYWWKPLIIWLLILLLIILIVCEVLLIL